MKKLFLTFALMISATAAFAAPVDSTFTIDGSKGKLAAHLQLPDLGEGETVPVVIVNHGLRGNQNEPFITDLADAILAEGLGVLRFDFNGHGQSEGKFEEMTVTSCVDDLKKAIEWLGAQPYAGNISVVGHSLGGLVDAVAAGQLGNQKVYTSVLLAPGGVARDLMLMGNFYGIKFDPWDVPDYITFPNGSKLGKAYIEDARDMPIYEIARLYQGPTLVVNGTHDRIVPISYSERFAYELPQAELLRLEGDNHGFTKNPKQTAQTVAAWFKRYNP